MANALRGHAVPLPRFSAPDLSRVGTRGSGSQLLRRGVDRRAGRPRAPPGSPQRLPPAQEITIAAAVIFLQRPIRLHRRGGVTRGQAVLVGQRQHLGDVWTSWPTGQDRRTWDAEDREHAAQAVQVFTQQYGA